MSLSINGRTCRSLHFVGICGSGMSALAQFCRWKGCMVSGSDRLSTSEADSPVRFLREVGCVLVPQDGTGIDDTIDTVVVSTAVEEQNPDLCEARRHSIPVVHRSEVLAAIVETNKTVAVAGTSGKSTVTAMIFECLSACGKHPSLVTGAPLLSLQRHGLYGNAFFGSGDHLVIEADESDGTITRYHPDTSVFLNVSNDHKPAAEIMDLFTTLARQSHCVLANGDAEAGLSSLTAEKTFGLHPGVDFRVDMVKTGPDGTTIRAEGHECSLPLIGEHAAANAAAALCTCHRLGCSLERCALALNTFGGIERRFTLQKTPSGVVVVDDYAHNPAKIRAALKAAHVVSHRVHALFQPHGFGPLRFMRKELIATFLESITNQDTLYLAPVYYAGGTVDASVTSEDIARNLTERKLRVIAFSSRKEAIHQLTRNVRPGDCILSMGARDPTLQSFAREIYRAFS